MNMVEIAHHFAEHAEVLVGSQQTEAVVQALSALGDLLAGLLPEARAALRSARPDVQSYEYADYVDLVHLADLLHQKLPSVATAATTLRTAALASGTYGANVRNSHGLSVWFPTSQQQYGEYRAKYLQLRCNAGGSGWVSFLDGYYA